MGEMGEEEGLCGISLADSFVYLKFLFYLCTQLADCLYVKSILSMREEKFICTMKISYLRVKKILCV